MAEQLRSFLRLKQVKAVTGMSRSWIYEAIRRGEFPAPITLGARAVAWDSVAVAGWQERRIQESASQRQEDAGGVAARTRRGA